MNLYLAQAIIHWKQGFALPVDLAMKLASLGYDVPKLEAKYAL